MKIEIFPATRFDLDALAKMFDAYRQFYRKKSDVKAAREFLEERIKKMDSYIFIAVGEDGNLYGFVQLYPIFTSVRLKKHLLLNDLFVDKDLRGKGISKMLIDCSKELAKEIGSAGLMLETEKSNEIGNALYPATGFKLVEGSNFYEWDSSEQ